MSELEVWLSTNDHDLEFQPSLDWEIIPTLIRRLRKVLFFKDKEEFNKLCDMLKAISVNLKNSAVLNFIDHLPKLDELVKSDLEAFLNSDPAACSKQEIVDCYLSFSAILAQRVAHVFWNLGVPILPRMITEYAHSVSGIDIHPAVEIGHHFFIDHGTGIVIGQTCKIGDNVKIYQGVTLGALSLRDGASLKGVKRHPTIGNKVTIYAGATILGGSTVIGDEAIIGCNALVVQSVAAKETVTR